MQQLTLTHTEGMQLVTNVRGHEVKVDLPPKYHGNDTAPTPPEYFVISFGSCVGMYALMYLKNQGLPTEGLKVELEWEEVEGPSRIGKITANITLPDGIEPVQARNALKAAEQCKIHSTLEYKPEICISIAERPEACLS